MMHANIFSILLLIGAQFHAAETDIINIIARSIKMVYKASNLSSNTLFEFAEYIFS